MWIKHIFCTRNTIQRKMSQNCQKMCPECIWTTYIIRQKVTCDRYSFTIAMRLYFFSFSWCEVSDTLLNDPSNQFFWLCRCLVMPPLIQSVCMSVEKGVLWTGAYTPQGEGVRRPPLGFQNFHSIKNLCVNFNNQRGR